MVQPGLAFPQVEWCRSTNPSQEENSLPLWKAAPLPTAATIAVSADEPG
jgi:hypothetical protein